MKTALSNSFRAAAGRALGAAVVVVALAAGVPLHAAPPALSVFTSVGTASGSPNDSAYNTNALNQISNRGGGTPSSAGTGPATYSVTNTVRADQVVFSSGQYNSWQGVADPGPITATYGPAYAGEFGSILRFGLDVVGDGVTRFSLSQLNVSTFIDGAAIDNFTGSDFAPGTFRLFALVAGNFIDVTSGATATTVVDRIVYRGAGLSFGALQPTSGQSDQDALNETVAGIPDPSTGQYPVLSATYTIAGSTLTTDQQVVPEPGTVAFSILGSLGLLTLLRRKGLRKI